jgi:Tfp pilus assembly protein PilN
VPEDISLLPKEVERKREQEARSRLLQKVSLGVLGVAVLFTAAVFIYSLVLKSQFSNLQQAVDKQESEISSLSEIELMAHDLDARVKTLQKILADKIYFSTLLTNVSQAVPADVSVVEMTIPSEETASLSGTSRSYSSLAKFLLNLKESDLFETVELRSVSLDGQTGEANFDLSLGLAKEGLQK